MLLDEQKQIQHLISSLRFKSHHISKAIVPYTESLKAICIKSIQIKRGSHSINLNQTKITLWIRRSLTLVK